MAKICPITNAPVLYLTCLECEDKICKKEQVTPSPMVVAVDSYNIIRCNCGNEPSLMRTEETRSNFVRCTRCGKESINAYNSYLVATHNWNQTRLSELSDKERLLLAEELKIKNAEKMEYLALNRAIIKKLHERIAD